MTTATARRAAVLGKPIAHSLSPVIHNAGYAAAGTVAPVAAAIGAANTLVREGPGWRAENTDAPGMVDALTAAGVSQVSEVAVLGAGGTARAAVAAVRLLGAAVTVYARRADAVAALRPVATSLGVALTAAGWADAAGCADADVVISTVPKGVADDLAAEIRWRPSVVVFDAIYDPWPTPLAAAAGRAGCTVVSGLDLLLAQAVRQFDLFTGRPAPIEAMRAALAAARR